MDWPCLPDPGDRRGVQAGFALAVPADTHQIALPRISVNDMNADLVLAQRLAPRLETLAQKV